MVFASFVARTMPATRVKTAQPFSLLSLFVKMCSRVMCQVNTVPQVSLAYFSSLKKWWSCLITAACSQIVPGTSSTFLAAVAIVMRPLSDWHAG